MPLIIRLKSKQNFYHDFWYEKGICTFSDLLYLDLSTPVLKSFDDLIMEFNISYKVRRKYNSLIKSIVNADGEILNDVSTADFMWWAVDPYESFSNNLILSPKVPFYVYILLDHAPPVKSLNFWNYLFTSMLMQKKL